VVLMFAIAFGIPAQMGPPIEFVTAMIEAFVGLGLSAVATWLAFFVAWRHGVKVWIDSAIHQARYDRAWPPQCFCCVNKASRLLLGALVITATPVIIAVLATGVSILGDANGGRNQFKEMCCAAGTIAPLTILVWTVGWLKDRASRAVIAVVPSECWDEGNHLPVDHRTLDDTAHGE
jgi:hypothetical protein